MHGLARRSGDTEYPAQAGQIEIDEHSAKVAPLSPPQSAPSAFGRIPIRNCGLHAHHRETRECGRACLRCSWEGRHLRHGLPHATHCLSDAFTDPTMPRSLLQADRTLVRIFRNAAHSVRCSSLLGLNSLHPTLSEPRRILAAITMGCYLDPAHPTPPRQGVRPPRIAPHDTRVAPSAAVACPELASLQEGGGPATAACWPRL